MSTGYAYEEYDNELLSHDQTLELIRRSQQGDEEAKEILVRKNVALVKSMVKRFLNRGYEYEDLFQIGTIGLIKAIQNYDEQYKVRFSTYAVPMIIGEIKRFLRDDGLIKVSRSLKELANKVVSVQEQLKKKLRREPTIQEIADIVGVDPEEIVEALEANKTPSSLYDAVYEDNDNPILLIDKVSGDDKEFTDIIDKIAIKDILPKLDKRERYIIIMRYFKDRTQSDIAKDLGISQVQVSRIEKKVLLKMRQML